MLNKPFSEDLTVAAFQNYREKEFWLNRFSRQFEKSQFLYDCRHTAEAGEREVMAECALSGELYSKLMQLSCGSDYALHVILLTGLVLLLEKYTGKKDILLGTPIYNQDIEGEYINTVLPLRCKIKSEFTVKELLLEVRQNLLEALANQNYPVEILVQQLNSNHSGNHFSLFDVALVLENIQDKDHLRHTRPTVIFSFDRQSEQIKGTCEYDSMKIKEATIARIFDHFRFLLQQMTAEVDSGISFNLLSPEEKNQILFQFNNGKNEFFPDRSCFQLVEERAGLIPNTIAVVFNHQHLTYRELNEKANQTGRVLADYGSQPDRLIAVLMERSPLMIISILAVWKSAGAYIPIDPRSPVRRRVDILKNSAARLIIASAEHIGADMVEEFSGNIIKLDEYENRITSQDRSNLDRHIDSGSLAYVIYTSGSTGVPKGVMIEHRGMMNHIQAKINDLVIVKESVIAQNATHIFDISVWQFFAALTVGGRIAIYPDELILEPSYFISRLLKDRITILEVVPSYLMVLLDSIDSQPVDFPFLDSLIVTGETLKPDLVERWLVKYPDIKVVNAYGPTEASDDITHHVMQQIPDTQRVPIGKKLQNFNIYVVGDEMELSPIGFKGEIWVSGVGIGRGYLNEIEKTNAAFTTDPFVRKQEARLYKTGDIGRFLPDGTIDFFGRKDDQVKIRGHRIELGEIERKIELFEEIKKAVVVDKEDAQGNKFICAYYLPAIIGGMGEQPGIIGASGKDVVKATELKEFLQKELPGYMIPHHFVELKEIPLKSNGKIDHQALPEPTVSSPKETYEAPRDEIEQKLVDVWANVMGIRRDSISISDNFFELGGDSIKAIQVSSRLQQSKLRVEIRDIYSNPTIKQLKSYVKRMDHTIAQDTVTGEVLLSPIQKAFFESRTTDRHHYNLPITLFSEKGFDEEIIKRVVEKTVRHHDALRMVFIENEEGSIIQTNRGLEVDLFELDTLDLTDRTDIEESIDREANRIQESISLAEGPLVKLGLFKTGGGDHLLIVIHHLVVDGVSWRIILEDFATGYIQASEGREIVLRAKTDSYQNWVYKLNDYASSQNLVFERDYWKLIEETAVERLPRDHEVDIGRKKNRDRDTVEWILDQSLTDSLLKKVNFAYNTDIDDILLTALGMAVKEWRGVDKILIALERHGREEIIEDININRTVGWFTSQFPVLLEMDRRGELSSKIKHVKESLKRIPNKGIGYGILRYLTPEAERAGLRFLQNPEISFNYLGDLGREEGGWLFQISDVKTGNSSSEKMEVLYTLDINAMIANGQLGISFTYIKYEYDRSSIDKLIGCYESNLVRIIDHCVNKGEREITPSDLTYSDISIDEFEAMQRKMSELR